MTVLTTEQMFAAIVAAARDIPGTTGTGLVKLYTDERERILAAPASRKAHQAWLGGYVGHIHDMLVLARVSYSAICSSVRPVPFLLSDANAAILLHDIEKPWKYVEPCVAMDTKDERQRFRETLCSQYELLLSDEVCNAIEYAEGEHHNYISGERTMGRLAAFVHSCDVMSARCFFDRPQ